MTVDPSTDLSTDRAEKSHAAVILAAGRGTRMGTVKALLPWGTKTLLEAWVDRLQALGVQHIVVVIGPHGPAIQTALAKRSDITWVTNPNVEESGPRESLLLGLAAIEKAGPFEAFWFTPVDTPVAGIKALQLVAAGFEEPTTSGSPVLAAIPTYEGHRGHPVLAASRFAGLLREGEPGDRLDAVFSWATRSLREVAVADARVGGNLNRPADLALWAPKD